MINNSSSKSANKESKRSFAQDFFEIFESVFIVVSVVFLLITCVFRLCQVSGRSMEDTLEDGQKLLVSEVFGSPKRGDIIVFHETGPYFNEPLVKRVISTGGEYVDIKKENGRLTVTVYDADMKNPVVLDEDYTKYVGPDPRLPSDVQYPVYVPEGYYFVMGDNRNNSSDSRYAAVGLVDSRRVLGRVILRLTPLSLFGPVD